jgi:chromosome segregation ATPase
MGKKDLIAKIDHIVLELNDLREAIIEMNREETDIEDPLKAYDRDQAEYEEHIDQLLEEIGVKGENSTQEVRSVIDRYLTEKDELSRTILTLREE